MTNLQDTETREDRPTDGTWPAEVDVILSAMDVGQDHPGRRAGPRRQYRVRAELRLFSDQAGTEPWVLYTRDATTRSLGFITPHRLPLGYGGHVSLETPDGDVVRAQCTLFRCREAAPGWFEGTLSFSRVQAPFAAEAKPDDR